MTPTNRDQLVALMARADLITKFPEYADDAKWGEHWQWYLDGRGNPDSSAHYSNQGLAVARANAVIDAMIKHGVAAVPATETNAQWAAMDSTAVVAEDWRGMTAPFVSGLGAAYQAAIATGRIDGGGR